MQVTGAFKARGALNNLLAHEIPSAGVCAASGGNHGQAVAWAARRLGVPAAVFVPTTCPSIKLRRLADYGAEVIVIGDVYDESLVSAEAYAADTGALLIHPFDRPLTVAGMPLSSRASSSSKGSSGGWTYGSWRRSRWRGRISASRAR